MPLRWILEGPRVSLTSNQTHGGDDPPDGIRADSSAFVRVGVLLARELGATAEYVAFGEDDAKVAAAAAKANAGAVGAVARRADAIELEMEKLRRRR